MSIKSISAFALSFALLAACSAGEEATPTSEETVTEEVVVEETAELPAKLEGIAAGTYKLDPTHAFLFADVTHNGISTYTVKFTDYDVEIGFNPAEPGASTMTATINPLGLETNYPADYKAGHADSGFDTWNDHIARSEGFLNADAFPEITFVTTSAETTGEYTGTITGDLSFRGTTAPVTLDVTMIGAINDSAWHGGADVLGFDATGTLSRGAFGSTAVGSVSDEVTLTFSGEFIQDMPEAEPAE